MRHSSPYCWAVFQSRESARKAVDLLLESSFSPGQVRVVYKRLGHGPRHAPMRFSTSIATGIKIGAPVGALLGMLGVGAVLSGWFPTMSALLAAHPLFALFQGIIGGATAGLVLGIFAGLAFWRDEPDFAESEENEEARSKSVSDAANDNPSTPMTVVVGVTARGGRSREAESILKAAGGIIRGEAVQPRSAPTTSETWRTT